MKLAPNGMEINRMNCLGEGENYSKVDSGYSGSDYPAYESFSLSTSASKLMAISRASSGGRENHSGRTQRIGDNDNTEKTVAGTRG